MKFLDLPQAFLFDLGQVSHCVSVSSSEKIGIILVNHLITGLIKIN